MRRAQMPKNADFLPGTLDMLILKTLTLGPNHGYGIAQHIRRTSQDALKIGEGSLYPALQRLLINEWVIADWGSSDTGRKVRTYRITAAGKKQLRNEVESFDGLLAGIARVMEAV
jgi:PadR family transcriptional regulator, regulatory protein PadR